MEKVSKIEKFAYSMGAFGQNFAFALMSTYLMFFYTDSVKLAAEAVGILFLVARIWDAAVDPFIGLMVDRVNTKWGKYRPFILGGGLVSSFVTMACFFNPQFDMTGKLIYAYITYILWGTTYSIMDVPYWAMAPSMTTDSNERTKILSIPKITGIISTVLVSIFTIPMVTSFGQGNSSKGYLITAIVFGAIYAGCAIFTAVKTKERVKIVRKKGEKFMDSLNVIIKNGPFLFILLMTLFANVALTVKQSAATYFFKYYMKDENLISVFAAVGILPMIAVMALVTPISKKIGKKSTAAIGGVLFAVPSFLTYFAGKNVPLIFIFNAIAMSGAGMILVMIISMQADTVEYAEWKTGKRSESIIFSFGTFVTQLSAGLGAVVIGYWLRAVGYVADAPQTERTLNGIYSMISWAPAVGFVLMLIVLYFYRLSEHRHSEIVKELELRHQEAQPVFTGGES